MTWRSVDPPIVQLARCFLGISGIAERVAEIGIKFVVGDLDELENGAPRAPCKHLEVLDQAKDDAGQLDPRDEDGVLDGIEVSAFRELGNDDAIAHFDLDLLARRSVPEALLAALVTFFSASIKEETVGRIWSHRDLRG
jgi:hypothetical protein